MADKIELNEELLGTISGGTTQEIAELKEAILANPKLADEWDSCAGLAAKAGKPNDDAAIIHFIFYFNFGHNEKLSEDKPNEYGWVFDHEDMLRMIRQYGNRG